MTHLRPSRLLLPLVLALIRPAVAPAQQKQVTVGELMSLRHLSDVQISPDGRRILYVLSHADFQADAWVPALWVLGVESGEAVPLARETPLFNRPLPAPLVRWSPDGRRISFLALADGTPQLFFVDADGGEPRQVTRAEEGVADYAWMPDGGAVAYLALEPPSDEEKRRRADKSWVIRVDRDLRPTRVWIQSLEGGGPRALTPPEHFVHSFAVSPDGATAAYSASDEPGFMAAYRTRIYTVPTAGGEPRPVVDRSGLNDRPRFSPDGRRIAFLTTNPTETILANLRLAWVPAAGGRVQDLTAHADQWVGHWVWAADGRSIYYLTDQNGGGLGAGMFEGQIFRVTVPGAEVRALTEGRRFISWIGLTRDGVTLAFKSADARSMGDVYVASTDPWRERRLTDLHPQMRTLRWGSMEPVSWESFDGMRIWGLLLLPPGYEKDRRIPVVVYCHGGPIGGFSYAVYPQFPHTVGQVSPYPVQALTGAGIGVLMPMPRGGSGYGEAGFRMIVNAWGEGDYRDIMAGVDHLVAAGIADPERLGVMGASYGGYMTSWIVTQTDRFRAASTGASVNDLEDLWALSDAGDFLMAYFGAPWESRSVYSQHSPLAHAVRVRTPLLIQHGQEDRRVPLGQARQLYRVLKALGRTVELDIYPRSGHVATEPDLQREMQQRNLDWFVRWLRP